MGITRAALQHESRRPFAAPLDRERLYLLLKTGEGEVKGVTVRSGDRYAPDEDDTDTPMKRDGSDGVHDYWTVTLPAPTRRVRYRFYLEAGDVALWWGEDGFAPEAKGVSPFQYPYLATADLFRQPEWLRGATLYQIFPDRFHNGDPTNDPTGPRLEWGAKPRGGQETAGGDLEGVRRKLAYLKDLGIGAFYMTPIFDASSNHKYNTADYYRIDPAFGTEETFKALVEEAHEKGIRVLLDAVFNHSGSDFFAFEDVREKGADSPYVSWFHRIDSFPVDPSLPNYETFGPGYGYMPKLNTADPACAAYLLDVAEHWIRAAGIDGWRLDVANEVDHAFWRRFRERVKAADPEAWILGEIWHLAHDWLNGDEFDSVMNYPWRATVLSFLKGESDAETFDRALRRIRYGYSPEFTAGLLNLLGSHDTARVRTELKSLPLAHLAAVLLFTSPGVPLVYYGDEIGMEGGSDPDCRRCMEWNPERQDGATRELYERLIRLRKESPWLMDGGWETLRAGAGERLLLLRRTPSGSEGAPPPASESEAIYVAINAEMRKRTFTLRARKDGLFTNGFTKQPLSKERVLSRSVAPYGYDVVRWSALPREIS